MTYLEPQYLEPYRFSIHYEPLRRYLDLQEKKLFQGKSSTYWKLLQNQPDLRAERVLLNSPVIDIGSGEQINPSLSQMIESQLRIFSPWRKGPFSVFDIFIDAEWRSDWKWQRIEPYLMPLAGKKICDVGCNNGYYMFRMAAFQPEIIIGLEPIARYWFNFQYLQKFAAVPNLHLQLMGFEQLDFYPEFFDTILLMGILYHHQDPLHILRLAHNALKPGGQIIVDSMTVPGQGPWALFPGKRYAKAPGVWYLPTADCLASWLHRTHFTNLVPIYDGELSCDEQRQTDWSAEESLIDFLDPLNSTLTVEGFPRPRRTYFSAHKKQV